MLSKVQRTNYCYQKVTSCNRKYELMTINLLNDTRLILTCLMHLPRFTFTNNVQNKCCQGCINTVAVS